MRTHFAIVSDVHAGGTTAVCPAEIPLDDGGTYRADGVLQTWLRNRWSEWWEFVKERRDGQLIVASNGDLVEGDHHKTPQIISRNPGAQGMAARILLDEALALQPDKLLFIRGTASHVGESGSAEESIARSLSTECEVIPTEVGTYSHWYARLECNGQQLSFAHHGRMGRRPWTRVQNVRYLAEQIWSQHRKRGEEPPTIAVRSHFHRYVNLPPAHPLEESVHLIQTPAWQLHTGHAWKVVPEDLADIGGVLITVDSDGHYTVEPKLFKADRGPTIHV